MIKFFCKVLTVDGNQNDYIVAVDKDSFSFPIENETHRVVYCNHKLEIGDIIYVYNSVLDTNKKLTINQYARVILQGTQAPEKEIVTAPLSDKIKELISDTKSYPVNLL